GRPRCQVLRIVTRQRSAWTIMLPNAGAQPRGPLPSGSRCPFGSAARVGCSGLLARFLIPTSLPANTRRRPYLPHLVQKFGPFLFRQELSHLPETQVS